MRKGAIISEYLPWLLIALAILAVLVITASLLKERGISIIDHVKNLIRGR